VPDELQDRPLIGRGPEAQCCVVQPLDLALELLGKGCQKVDL
jgi:hypothetical protein